MTIERVAPARLRLAIGGASDAFCARLRARFGLTATSSLWADSSAIGELAYCGRDFRAYAGMRIGAAARFYGALHARWNVERLREALALAGLEERFEIGRMKRAYQRALVVAFALASEPTTIVVEQAEEFDTPGAVALLERAIAVVPRVIVTFGQAPTIRLRGMPEVCDAADVVLEAL